jgi:hypothetical protein
MSTYCLHGISSLCICFTPEFFSSARDYRIKDGDRETEVGDYVVVMRRESDIAWKILFVCEGRGGEERSTIISFYIQGRTHRGSLSLRPRRPSLPHYFVFPPPICRCIYGFRRPHLSELCMTDEGLCLMSTADDSATCSPHVLFLASTYPLFTTRWNARSRITNTPWCWGRGNVVINKQLAVLRTTE